MSFSKKEIRRLAVESGFYRRAGGKLTGEDFLELMVFHSEQLKHQSLEDLSIILETSMGITVSKQSLHERFNAAAAQFLSLALGHLLRNQLQFPDVLKQIKGFKRILVKDSTSITLHNSLCTVYPAGNRADSQGAAIRIQFEYDVLSGRINDLSVQPSRDQDNQNWIKTNALIEHGDLIIRDLGYISQQALIDLMSKNADVVCRLSGSTDVYHQETNAKGGKVSFKDIQKTMRKRGVTRYEIPVVQGKENPISLRMVIYDLPDHVAAANVRRIRKRRIHNGSKTIKKETLIRAHLVIIVTTADASKLKDNDLYLLYKTRWQIELIFKAWKSVVNVDKVKNVQCNRLQCYLYARLLLVIMIWQFYWAANTWWFSHCKKRISLHKTFSRIVKHVAEIRQVFLGTSNTRYNGLRVLGIITNINGCVETKKGDCDYTTAIERMLMIMDENDS